MRPPSFFSLCLVVAMGWGLPLRVWADPIRDRHRDAVFEDGISLARYLLELKLSHEEVRRRDALERARMASFGDGKDGGIWILPMRKLKASSARWEEGSLNWLMGQSDAAQTGIIPIKGREGLLVSYVIPPDDPLAFLRGRSWTYDNALAAVALVAHSRYAQANKILSTLKGLMSEEGTIGFSYQVDSEVADLRIRTGTLAWVGYAMAYYQRQTRDATFQTAAERIARYLKTLQHSTGSLRGGPDVGWVSTEHNIGAYFFLRELARVTGNAEYRSFAQSVRNSLLNNHWTLSGSQGHFLRGLDDPTPSLDANALGAIFLKAIGQTDRARQTMRYIEDTFRNTQGISGTTVRLTGYAPDDRRQTVWLEGTAQVGIAYLRLGDIAQADRILAEAKKVELLWQSQGRWRGAFPYAIPRYQNSDGDTFLDLESVGSTGWLLVTLAVRDNRRNGFWDPERWILRKGRP